MTENKRFKTNNDVNFNDKIETYELNCIVDNDNETFYFIADSIENVQLFVKRLNELNEENIELHIQNDFLKDENQHMRDLVNENEQLKKENMEYHHLVSCDNCKYHNYDWFDDGDEFEVCDKGHTERLMYNKFCKEWREFE